MTKMFQVILLFATVAYGLRTKLHMTLQAEPDANCQQWLATDAGQEYLLCDSGNPGLPVPYNQTNNCELTFEDYNVYCNNSCYNSMVKAWEFFLNTSTCLNVEQDKYKPCANNSDCPVLGDGLERVCFEGFCYRACNSTADCNPCMNETCVTFNNGTQGIINGTQGNNGTQGINGTLTNSTSQGCRSSSFSFVNGSALMNRTLQNTFRAQLYSLKAACSTNANNLYCGLMELSNQTCASLKSQWGCCASTYLPSIQYCEWTRFSNSTLNNLITNCTWDVPPCGGMDWAWQFCGFNVTNNGTNNNGSSSSSSSAIIGTNSSSSSGSSGISNSSNIIGTNSSSSSGISSSSSNSLFTPNSSNTFNSNVSGSWSGSSLISSLTSGIGTNHTNNNTASGRAAVSWTVTIAMVLAAAHIVS
jgi:hypothetical protein